MKNISPLVLQQKIINKEDFQLIDVREANEHTAFNIGGELMPLSELMDHVEKISTNKPVIVYCKKGIRSQIAIQRLEEKFQFSNLINLSGGLDAWLKEINSL
jgi:rhodanese-related sulfurtransferase